MNEIIRAATRRGGLFMTDLHIDEAELVINFYTGDIQFHTKSKFKARKRKKSNTEFVLRQLII